MTGFVFLFCLLFIWVILHRVPLVVLYSSGCEFSPFDTPKLWKTLREMGIPDHLTCLLRNLYAGQEATVRTGHGTTDWFQIEQTGHPAYLTCMQSSVHSLSHVQLFATPWTAAQPGLPVHHQLLEIIQTHVHWVGDAIQPSHPLLSPSLPTLNISQHQGLYKWVSSSHQVAKVLELQLQNQSYQWTPKTDLL